MRTTTLILVLTPFHLDLVKCTDSPKELGYMKMVAKYRMLRY